MQIQYIKLVKYKRFPLSDSDIFEHTFNTNIVMINGQNGSGKAQPLSSAIKVPSGWSIMGNMKIGKEIIARDGTIAKVNGVFPQGRKDIYRLTFIDGRSTRATGDHLWKVYLSNDVKAQSLIVTTTELINLLSTNAGGICIDLPTSEQSKDMDLPIDPYILGVILGGGHLSTGGVVITSPDEFIKDKVKQNLPYGLTVSNRSINNNTQRLAYSIVSDKEKNSKCNAIVLGLRKCGLIYKRSYEKFIPNDYLYGSINQRLELLQALMDTGGEIKENSSIVYSTISYLLAKQITYLVRSIGGIASISISKSNYTYKGETHRCRSSFQVDIKYSNISDLFTLPRKKDIVNSKSKTSVNLKLSLYSIVPDGFEEAQCISIDHPDKLYVTDDFIVTHNTSLSNELTPLPSDKSDFYKGGYKEIHIEKNGSIYKLISDFTESPKYYFYLNGENINQSHNVTSQRDLVYTHFRLTQGIHNILVGKEMFTNMSLLARKKLFTAITHLNLDSILNNYNKLKEELKNNEFLLKSQSSLRQAEEQKLTSSEHIDNIRNISKLTREQMDTLLLLRESFIKEKKDYDSDKLLLTMSGLHSRLIKVIDIYYTYVTAFPSDNKSAYDVILKYISSDLDSRYSRLERLHQEVTILSSNDNLDLLQLTSQLKELEDRKHYLLSSLTMYTDITKLDLARSVLYKMETTLPDIITHITPNPNREISKEGYERAVALRRKLLEELTSMLVKETEISKEIEHLLGHGKSAVCPKCAHKWSPDTDDIIFSYKQDLDKLLKDKITKQKLLQETTESIDNMTEYFSIYKQYITIRESTAMFASYWHTIDKERFIFNEPTKILSLLSALNGDIVTLGEIDTLAKTISDMQRKIDSLSRLQNTNIDKINGEIFDLEQDTQFTQLEKDIALNNIRNNDNAVRASNLIKSLSFTANTLLDDYQLGNVSFTLGKLVEIIDAELSRLKVTLIELDRTIANYNNVHNIIHEHDIRIADTKNNILVLEIILNELSPKNGLIAKSISSFLNVIIAGVNSVIANVWDYKMVLKDIDIEEETLMYKFKVEVEDRIVIDDITLVSAGMREIINLSFKLVMYKLLNLEGYPLWLDEMGANLDSIHTGKILSLIHQLSISGKYSQIFLISHKENFGYLKNVSIIEL